MWVSDIVVVSRLTVLGDVGLSQKLLAFWVSIHGIEGKDVRLPTRLRVPAGEGYGRKMVLLWIQMRSITWSKNVRILW